MLYLLEQAGLTDHLMEGLPENPEEFSMAEPDYAKVRERLAERQEASRKFLKNCLKEI